jgi:hypothetical protein
VHRERDPRAAAATGRPQLEPGPVRRHDRELGRDEERRGQDEQGDGREPERRSYGCRRFMSGGDRA